MLNDINALKSAILEEIYVDLAQENSIYAEYVVTHMLHKFVENANTSELAALKMYIESQQYAAIIRLIQTGTVSNKI